ncbi:hypothetical protein AAVH_11662 [Aphelenchoides avenae]|nr:hypothetical protein AAVH_11662 [Aphelenchus avenae]
MLQLRRAPASATAVTTTASLMVLLLTIVVHGEPLVNTSALTTSLPNTTRTSHATSAIHTDSPRPSTEPATTVTTGPTTATSGPTSLETSTSGSTTISDATSSTTQPSETTDTQPTDTDTATGASQPSTKAATGSSAVPSRTTTSPTTTTATVTTTTTTVQPPSPEPVIQSSSPEGGASDESEQKSNTGMIIGVVAVILLLCLIAGGIVVYCVHRRRKKRTATTSPQPPHKIPTFINNPRIVRTPKTPKPSAGFRATGPNAPFHYKAEDFHFMGPAKFDTRAFGVEDLPEPTSTETALSMHSKSEHVEFDKDLNEVYEIGSEVEEYLDRPNPKNKMKKGKKKADRAIKEDAARPPSRN